MDTLNSLIDAIAQYRKEGYAKQNCLKRGDGKYKAIRDHFNIDKYYRFEKDTNPDDESIICAI